MSAQGQSTTMQLKKVLVATDFSPGAEAALRWAEGLAQRFGAELMLVHALDLSLGAVAGLPSDVAMMPAVEELSDRVRAEVKEQMAQVAAQHRGTRAIIREGVPRVVILEVARDEHADLIVVGTHGRTGLAQVFFGSVAAHVVRHSHVPVLTVRHSDQPS